MLVDERHYDHAILPVLLSNIPELRLSKYSPAEPGLYLAQPHRQPLHAVRAP
jgi:hypothetical protein